MLEKDNYLTPGSSKLRIRFFLRYFVPIIVVSVLGCGNSNQKHPESEATSPIDVKLVDDSVTPADQALSDEQRSHLWDVEHLGFVIERTVFPLLKQGMNSGDFSAWELATNKTCVVVPVETIQPISHLQNQVSQTSSNRPDIHSDSIPLMRWLEQLRSHFDPTANHCRSSIGLVRLIPTERDELAGSFNSVWRMRIAGTKDSKPVELETEFALTLSNVSEDVGTAADWIQGVSVINQRVISSQQSLFEDWTARSGLVSEGRRDNWNEVAFKPNTGGVYVTDYDEDGHLDVFIDDLDDGNRLYRGTGQGTFVESTLKAGIVRSEDPPLWALSCWADFDGDGDDDLITEDQLYENLGNGTFKEITDHTNLPLTPAAGYAIGDYNCDGRIDLYVCHTSAYRAGQEQKSRVKWIDDGLGIDNVLLRNDGDWQFTDVTAETKTGGNGSSCFSAVWINANGDRWPDLFAINEFGRNSLLLNQKGETFLESDVDPVFGGFSMGVSAGDYDNDGLTDLYVANMYSKAGNRILANVDTSEYPQELFDKINEGTKGSKLYRNRGDGTFETISPEDSVAYVGWAYGPTFFDLNNDGWLDIYATAGFKSVKRGEPDG